MDTITTRELAQKWNVSIRTVNMYLNAGRVDGAVRKKGGWLIPADAPYPGTRSQRTVHKHFMPLWQAHEVGAGATYAMHFADAEERETAEAARLYHRGQLDEARQRCVPLADSRSPEIRLSALLVHMMASVPFGDAAAVYADVRAFRREREAAQTPEMQAACRFIHNISRVLFHEDEDVSVAKVDWLGVLPMGTRLFAIYAMAHALYLKKDYAQALGMARSALITADDRYPPVCVYLNLIACVAAMNLDDATEADHFFLRAWSLAERDGYLHPFAEHHGLLMGQVEKHFRDKDPALYEQISGMVMRFSRGWMKIHNPNSVNKVTDTLSPYEFSVAMMAAKGKSNREIAEFLNVSVNTVKSYLSVIYQKVGVVNRAELAKYVNK